MFIMILQKQLSRRIGNTEYAKYVIVVPPDIVKEMKWKDGDELVMEVKKDSLSVTKKS